MSKETNEDISISQLFVEMYEDKCLKDEIGLRLLQQKAKQRYQTGQHFVNVDYADDIFEVHPEAIKAIHYKPKKR